MSTLKVRFENDVLHVLSRALIHYTLLTPNISMRISKDAHPDHKLSQSLMELSILGDYIMLISNLKLVPVEENDNGPISFPICDLLDLQSQYLLPNGLHQAAFWVGLRQEIYLAIMNERPTGLYLRCCNFDRSMDTADDEIWAKRIILHLVDVLEYCFGSDSSYDTYDNLVEYSVAWAASKPDSFCHVYVRQARGEETFPWVVFLNNTIMVALQYYYLVRILLTAHNPKIPRLGIAYKVASRSIDVSLCHKSVTAPLQKDNGN